MDFKTTFVSVSLLALTAPMVASTPTAVAQSQSVPCGMSPNDWCHAPPGDPCGRHDTVAACRADPACYGMPYRGESVVACDLDKRGFSSNCPTIGCTSTPPQPTTQKPHDASSSPPGVVNWNPPTKRGLVERALADGMTDPAKIVAWARNYKVIMTVDEVLGLKAELGKQARTDPH